MGSKWELERSWQVGRQWFLSWVRASIQEAGHLELSLPVITALVFQWATSVADCVSLSPDGNKHGVFYFINHRNSNALYCIASHCNESYIYMCASLAQLARSLIANQKVPGSIPGLVESWILGDLLSPHRPWTDTLSRRSSLLTWIPGDLKNPDTSRKE